MSSNYSTTNTTQWVPPTNLTASDFSNTGRISVASLFGFAALVFFGRILIRLLTRKRLFLDDAFLILSFLCLCAGTVILILRNDREYLVFALLREDPRAYSVALVNMGQVYAESKWHLAYMTVLWTSVFAVKWCYLAFFRPLLQNMSRYLVWYYWATIGLSIASWIFIGVGEQVTSCSHVDKAASTHCFPELPASRTLLLAMFWAYPCLDALTDLMIMSIPIFLLWKVQMKLITKLGIGLFLCLSAFMLACAIIRGAGTIYKGAIDYPWGTFWLHIESCVGVMMASFTVYRSTLIGDSDVSEKFKLALGIGASSRRPNTSTNDTPTKKQALSVSIPRPTLSGLRTWFGGTSWTRTNHELQSLHSYTSRDETVDNYHDFLVVAPKGVRGT
ncbi:hypothetical protein BJX99DRAFT_245448 [Aspergillus californicus]